MSLIPEFLIQLNFHLLDSADDEPSVPEPSNGMKEKEKDNEN